MRQFTIAGQGVAMGPRSLMSALVLSLAAATGCVTDTVTLGYKTAGPLMPPTAGSPVTVGSFVDQRGETQTWIGAVRGGYGNPLKKLETDKPVSMLVQTAFADGLKERGLLATGSGGYQISGVIKRLDCSQYVRREAHAAIDVSVSDPSGLQVFSRTYTADELEGSLLALNVGVFGNVDTLRALAEKALNEVVDKALDDTALRSSLRPSTQKPTMTFDECFSKCRDLTNRSQSECFDSCRH